MSRIPSYSVTFDATPTDFFCRALVEVPTTVDVSTDEKKDELSSEISNAFLARQWNRNQDAKIKMLFSSLHLAENIVTFLPPRDFLSLSHTACYFMFLRSVMQSNLSLPLRDQNGLPLNRIDRLLEISRPRTVEDKNKYRSRLSGHSGGIMQTKFSPDETLFATVSYGRNVMIWNAELGIEICTLSKQIQSGSHISFSPDGTNVVAAVRETNANGITSDYIMIFCVKTGAVIKKFEAVIIGDEISIAFSPDGRKIAAAGYDMHPIMWSVDSGCIIRELRGEEDAQSPIFSRNGEFLAVLRKDLKTVLLWNIATSENFKLPIISDTCIHHIAFNPNNTSMAVTIGDHIIIWDLREKTTMKILCNEPIRKIIFSPDGKIFAAILGLKDGGNINIYDAITGEVIQTLVGHTDIALNLIFSQDGKKCATHTLDDNSTAIVWDISTGTAIHSFRKNMAFITSIDFSRDGKKLITSFHHKNAVMWDAETGKIIYTIAKNREDKRRAYFLKSLFIKPSFSTTLTAPTTENLPVMIVVDSDSAAIKKLERFIAELNKDTDTDYSDQIEIIHFVISNIQNKPSDWQNILSNVSDFLEPAVKTQWASFESPSAAQPKACASSNPNLNGQIPEASPAPGKDSLCLFDLLNHLLNKLSKEPTKKTEKEDLLAILTVFNRYLRRTEDTEEAHDQLIKRVVKGFFMRMHAGESTQTLFKAAAPTFKPLLTDFLLTCSQHESVYKKVCAAIAEQEYLVIKNDRNEFEVLRISSPHTVRP